jgi:hypothetical protein
MTNLDLKNKLAELLPDYKFDEINLNTDCIYGVKQLENKTFRLSNKSLIQTRNRVIFVSSEMYPDTDRNFRYALNYTQSRVRGYRRRYWSDYEYEKVYVSGKTDEELINEIVQNFKSN